MYVVPVASKMFTPSRCHWKSYWLPLPVQVPRLAVSSEARCTVPEMLGATVFNGGEPATRTEAALAARPVPSGLVTVTSRRTTLPTSPGTST